MIIKPYIDDEPEQGLPVAPTREELYRRLKEKYMKQRSEAEQTLEQPYETPTDLAESKRLSALTSGLSKAAAQMGSIRGKSPTTTAPETLSEFDKAQELEVMAGMKAREQAKSDLDVAGKSLLAMEDAEGLRQREFEAMDVPIDENLRLTVNQQLTQKGSKLQLPRGITNRQIKSNPLLSRLIDTASAATSRDRIQIREVLGADLDPKVLGGKSLPPSFDPNRYYNVAYNIDNPELSSVIGATRLGDVGFAVDKTRKTTQARLETKEGIEEAADIREAEAKAGRWNNYATEMRALRDEATLVGPAAGRLADIASNFGISLDDKATALRVGLQRQLNAYIKELSGAAVNAAEEKRLLGVMPTIKDDKDTFKTKLDALKKEADKLINEKKAKARPTTPEPKVRVVKSADELD